MCPPLLLGHRGARATRAIPENTLESFELALAHGCDGFEFDVRLTADGRAVICHDPSIGDRDVSGAGSDDLNHLPQLSAVLARFAPQAFLDIELKVPGLEQVISNAIKPHCPARGYVVSSFLPEVLQALHALDASIPLGLICEDAAQLAAWRSLPVECVIPHHSLLDGNLCSALHGAGKKVIVWTVNSRKSMLYFRDIEVDAIISDKTKLLVETVREAAKTRDLRPET